MSIQSLPASRSFPYPNQAKIGPLKHWQPIAPLLQFGEKRHLPDPAAQIREEAARIKAQDRPILIKTAIKISLLHLFGAPFFPASLMPSWRGLGSLLGQLTHLNTSANAQATFNVTRDLNALSPYLPYRKKLNEQGSTKLLAQYDAVLQKVLKGAEFYETTQPKDLTRNLKKLWTTEDYLKEQKELFSPNTSKFGFLFKFLGNRDFRMQTQAKIFALQQKYIAKLDEAKMGQLFRTMQPLSQTDAATRYLIAGQVAELLFKNPQYLDKVLKTESGYPLRFVLTKNSPTMALGAYTNGLNVITLNKTLLWMPPGKTLAQHEFIHASSAQSGVVGDTLPYMSQAQQQSFREARDWLVRQHEEKGSSLLGKLNYLFTGKTVTGLRNYAFFNNYEFLTVTLDTFKKTPQKLCQTEAGKTVYNIYKDLFGLDPLNDFKEKTK